MTTTVSVPTVGLDAYLDRQGIATVPLTLIDVEGYESRALEGMSAGIAGRRYAIVLVEFHPWAFPEPAAELGRIADRFLAAGYACFRFRHNDGPHCDKDAAYYDLRWDDSILAPLMFDDLGPWEHCLFVAGREGPT